MPYSCPSLGLFHIIGIQIKIFLLIYALFLLNLPCLDGNTGVFLVVAVTAGKIREKQWNFL